MIALNEPTEIILMGQDEARRTIETIKTNLDSTRRLLLDLYNREGWRALGYDSWRDCAQAEFGQSVAYLYRQLSAAKIERDMDSPIGEIPESHLREAAKSAPADRPRVIERATELAGAGPRTAKHITQAAAEIAAPDLPLEFAVIQRRYVSHGHMLTSTWDGVTRRYVVRKDGGTGVVMTWDAVLSKLERIEAESDPAHVERLEAQIESDRIPEAGMVITPPPPPSYPANASAYDQQEHADIALMRSAHDAIERADYAGARKLLDQVQVAIYERDQVLSTLVRSEATRFWTDQTERLQRFSKDAMISQTTFKQALAHIQAWIEAPE